MPNLIFMIFLYESKGNFRFFLQIAERNAQNAYYDSGNSYKTGFFSSKENIRIYRHHRSQEPHTQRTTCHPNSQFP